jgi:hypothetical protein
VQVQVVTGLAWWKGGGAALPLWLQACLQVSFSTCAALPAPALSGGRRAAGLRAEPVRSDRVSGAAAAGAGRVLVRLWGSGAERCRLAQGAASVRPAARRPHGVGSNRFPAAGSCGGSYYVHPHFVHSFLPRVRPGRCPTWWVGEGLILGNILPGGGGSILVASLVINRELAIFAVFVS